MLTAVLVTAFTTPGRAQLGPSRAAVVLSLLAFEGTGGESGVGVGVAGQHTLSSAAATRLAVEVGFHLLDGLAIWVPPASPVWHVRLLASARFTASLPFYLLGGVGVYGPVGPEDRAAVLAVGFDVGLGIRVSTHVAFEARYLDLRTTRLLGRAIPIALLVGF